MSSIIPSSKAADTNLNELIYICTNFGGRSKFIATSSEHIDALNALLKKKGCDFSVKFETYPEEGYREKVNELKKSGSKTDLIFSGMMQCTADTPYVYFIKDCLYADLSSYLESSKGKDLKKACCSKSIENQKFNAETYAIAVQTNMGNSVGFYYNVDLLKKYNIDKNDLNKELWDLEPVIKKVAEGEKNTPDFTTVSVQMGKLDGLFYYDMLSEAVGAVMRSDKPQAINCYNDPYAKNYLKTMKKYVDAGYITESTNNSFMFAAGVEKKDIDKTYKMEVSPNRYVEYTYVPTLPVCSTYSCLQAGCNGIASWSKNKDMAFEFLYLMNTDKDVADLMAYGIEGKDYDITNGAVKPKQNQALRLMGDYYFVNNFILTPRYDKNYSGSSLKKDNEEMQSSSLLGFFFDRAPAEKEIKATDAVAQKWDKTLWAGKEANFDKAFAGLNKGLKDAGIDKVISEANKQISTFKAKKHA